MADAPVTIRVPPAKLGQHTQEVLAEAGAGARDRGRVMPILFELKDHVARVTIDRPDVLNAIDAASERELQKIWSEIESNRDVRCVVLTGTGERAFSTGADMKGGSGASGLEYWALSRPGGFGGIALRETLDVPVIARVNGHAVGGGFEMVLGCDIIVAAEEATFGLPEARVGRMPLDGGMTLLQRQVPFHLAMGVLLTGKRISAAEAFRIGLVNEVVPRAELDAAVARWVDDVLACAPLSVRAIKQVVRRTAQLSAAEARDQLLPALAEALQSEDCTGGRARLHREAQAGVAGEIDALRHHRCLHRREGQDLPRRLSGRLHLRGRPHALHPARRMHRLRAMRDRLPGRGDPCRRPAARRVEALDRDQPRNSSAPR